MLVILLAANESYITKQHTQSDERAKSNRADLPRTIKKISLNLTSSKIWSSRLLAVVVVESTDGQIGKSIGPLNMNYFIAIVTQREVKA